MGHAQVGRYRLGGGTDKVIGITGESFEDRVEGQWFSARVDRKAFKALMKRSDDKALRDCALWLGPMVLFGIAGVLTWGTLWCIPAFLCYGVLYSASDHRAHEFSHGTPFRTRWINECFYCLAAFMTLHESVYWRWSHSRHHTDTLQVGLDPEIAVPRPPDVAGILLDVFYIKSGYTQIKYITQHALGRLSEEGLHFVPPSERAKVFWNSRLYLLIFALVIAACVACRSVLPAMLVVLPRFYGGFIAQLFNITQHAGLAEDILDHRLNTRTFRMNPVFEFLYMNMNYHIEHHMFPMVPFYNLPALHAMIKDQCPPVYPNIWAVYREIVPAILRQVKEPTYYVRRTLPPSATLAAAE